MSSSKIELVGYLCVLRACACYGSLLLLLVDVVVEESLTEVVGGRELGKRGARFK